MDSKVEKFIITSINTLLKENKEMREEVVGLHKKLNKVNSFINKINKGIEKKKGLDKKSN